MAIIYFISAGSSIRKNNFFKQWRDEKNLNIFSMDSHAIKKKEEQKDMAKKLVSKTNVTSPSCVVYPYVSKIDF